MTTKRKQHRAQFKFRVAPAAANGNANRSATELKSWGAFFAIATTFQREYNGENQ